MAERVSVNVKFPADLLEALTAKAKAEGVPRMDVIISACADAVGEGGAAVAPAPKPPTPKPPAAAAPTPVQAAKVATARDVLASAEAAVGVKPVGKGAEIIRDLDVSWPPRAPYGSRLKGAAKRDRMTPKG